MRTSARNHAAILAAMLLCAACATPMMLPEGAGDELAYKQPVLFMSIDVIDQTSDPELKFSAGALAAARVELESLMPRMKRFKFYSVFNTAGKQLARELAEIGEIKDVSGAALPAPDAFLNVNLTVNCEKATFSGRNDGDTTLDERRKYEETLFFNLTDAQGRILDVRESSGTLVTAPLFKDIGRIVDLETGKVKFKAAFNPADEVSQAAVIRELTRDLNKKLASLLARCIPLTAEVTSINPSGTAFVMDRGGQHGVYPGGQVTVWARIGDFDYAIAETISEPTAARTTLRVQRWNSGDPEAARVVRELQSDPNAIKRYKMFGTTTSIPADAF